MGKALVIKGVDFGSQKLAKVNFTETVPCTGISLSESTKAMTSVGSTFTLIPTVTPENTTDSVVWSSSNDNAATVSNGVVTQTGVGTVVITATCGTQTASCTVTATKTLTFSYALSTQIALRSETKDYSSASVNGVSANYACLFNDTDPQTYKIENLTNGGVAGNIYAIPLAENASSVKIEVPNNIRATVWFSDSDTVCDYYVEHGSGQYAKFISGDASPYDSSVSVGDRTVSVPEGANSINITLQKPGSGNEVTAEDIAEVVITVS